MENFSRDETVIVIKDCGSMSVTISNSSLDTEVVASKRFESATNMKRRLLNTGYVFVERSIVKFGKEIGRGGQGTVYEAWVSWPYVKKAMKMAVKKFNPNLGMSQGQYPLELWTTDNIHVLQPKAFFLDDDSSLCMIMSLYSGDLRSAINNEKKKCGTPFKEEISFSIIMQLATGMKALHSAGVCHRDLKAANILVRSTPVYDALVAEAGIKVMHMCRIADFEHSENVKGTAYWRAPEVLKIVGTEATLTNQEWKAADVYSFGMVCYEIVTGEIPFEGKRLFLDRHIVINGGRPELPEYVPEVLRKIITKCWHPCPDCRPDFEEILGTLMRKAQEDLRLGRIPSALEWMEGISNSKSKSLLADLMQLKELVGKHHKLNDDGIVGHQNYATWGLKYVHYVEKFIELLRKEEHVPRMMIFVDYIESQKLSALIRHSLMELGSSLRAADAHQHYKDIMHHGILFLEEKLKVGNLVKNIYEELQKEIQMIGLHNNNDMTLKEKLKIVNDVVTDVKGTLDENMTLGLLESMLIKVDLGRTNNEVAIFRKHMKFVIQCTAFQKKYDTLLYAVYGSIMLYVIYTSSTWNYILFQIFGVVLSDSCEVYLGFLCPLLRTLLYNRLVFRFPKYHIYFSIFYSIVRWYITIELFRNYGFRRELGWLGIWYCLNHGLPFSYALILRVHEYLYMKLIRVRARSTFTSRVKRKEE